MNKVKDANYIVFLTLGACFATMIDNATGGGGIFKIIALTMDVFVIAYCLLKTNVQYFLKNITPACLLVIVIMLINFMFSPYNPRYSLLLKYFGYMTFFIYAKFVAQNGYVFRCKNYLLYSMIFMPLLFVFLFDTSPTKSMYFPNSNMFTFWGISMSLAYLLFKEHNKRNITIAWLIVLSYILVGTSLGVLIATILSTLILNYKRINFILLLIAAVSLVLCIAYVDIPVFMRLRDSFMIFQMLSWSDFVNPMNVNFYEIQMEYSSSGRMDNASFLWRILQWITLLGGYIVNILNIPFGNGADWSIAYSGKPPHNDYVLILVDYGLVIFVIIVLSIKKIFNKLKKLKIIYFIFPIFIYHITENLLDTFPQNVFFYLSLGYYYSLALRNNDNTIN